MVGEPFRQWVIEDDFNRPRPRWDMAGAEFVRDVEPYEFVKMRVLNACQTALSYLGALSGLGTTCDDVRRSAAEGFRRAHDPRRDGSRAACRAEHAGRPLSEADAFAARQPGDPPFATTRSRPMVRRRSTSAYCSRCATAWRRASPRRCWKRPLPAGSSISPSSQPAFGAAWQANDRSMPFRRRHRATIVRRYRRLHEALHRQPRDLRRQAGRAMRPSSPASLSGAQTLLADGVAKTLGARDGRSAADSLEARRGRTA